jgi:hypothetical protein
MPTEAQLEKQRAALQRVGPHLAPEIDYWWRTIGDAIPAKHRHGHYARSKIIRALLARYHSAPSDVTLQQMHDAALHVKRLAEQGKLKSISN